MKTRKEIDNIKHYLMAEFSVLAIKLYIIIAILTTSYWVWGILAILGILELKSLFNHAKRLPKNWVNN